MKEIQLTQGKVALVDDEDFEYLNQWRWYAAKRPNLFYAERKIIVDGKRKNTFLHWDIMGGKGIDHIDHNGLNNQKANLRFCTPSQNNMNFRKSANKSSLYKGVCFLNRKNKWLSSIRINGKNIHLGYFDTEVDAAKAYNKKAIELFGEFANLNKFEIEKLKEKENG